MNRVTIATSATTNASFQAITDVQANFKVNIQVDATNPHRLEQARLANGILGRIFKNVHVLGAQPAQLAHVGSLRGHLNSSPQVADFTVTFGGPQIITPHIHGDYLHWAAVLSTQDPTECKGDNVLAALYASALACQHAYNVAFRHLIPQITTLDGTAEWDLATGNPGPTPDDVPPIGPVELDATIVGIGAVGQAIVHALSVLPALGGTIELVDHEFLDQGNAERYILTTMQHVGQYKPQVARTVLAQAHPLLKVNYPAPSGSYPLDQPAIQFENRHALPVSAGSPGWSIPPRVHTEYLAPPLTYLGWRDMDGTTPGRLIVAAVDSAVTRRDIQFGLHREAVNAWTDSGPGLTTWGYSFHKVGQKQCLACQYHPLTQDPGTTLDFQARQVGWNVEKVRTYLEDPSKVLTPEDLENLQRTRGHSAEYLQQFLGKPLKRFIEGLCGQGAAIGNDRIAVPPVPHVPVIVGIHTAAALVLRALNYQTPERVQGDSLRLASTSFTLPLANAQAKCLCQNTVIQGWYNSYWKLDQ